MIWWLFGGLKKGETDESALKCNFCVSVAVLDQAAHGGGYGLLRRRNGIGSSGLDWASGTMSLHSYYPCRPKVWRGIVNDNGDYSNFN